MGATAALGSDDFAVELDVHRRELTGYCYRMLGAGSEAEDAVQETFLRAWRARDRFAHRSTLKTWLYKIATNVCLDMPQRPQRRARPMDLVSPSTSETAVLHRASRVPLGAAGRRRQGTAGRRRPGRAGRAARQRQAGVRGRAADAGAAPARGADPP